MAEKERPRTRTQEGLVVSSAMNKSIVVRVKRKIRHRRYNKYVTVSKRYMAHDEENSCADGDRVIIAESRPRGGENGLTKSGRPRRVALSKRLRLVLSLAYRKQFEPNLEARVLEGINPANFRKREWRRILKRAKVGSRRLKDLRDTYASQLLTAGVQLGYVSHQLGHSDVSVTARHYARWAGGDAYRDPLQLEGSEVPTDLLARLRERPQTRRAARDLAAPIAHVRDPSMAVDPNPQ